MGPLSSLLTCHTWIIPFLARELVHSIWTHGRKAKIDSEQRKLPCVCFLCIFFKSAHRVVKLKKFFIKPTEATNHTGKNLRFKRE